MKISLGRIPKWARRICFHCKGKRLISIDYGCNDIAKERCPLCEGDGYVLSPDVAMAITLSLVFGCAILSASIALSLLGASL